MHPSRPSSTDPNAPYRAAIAALGGDFVNEQETVNLYPGSNQYQQNAQEGLAPRRNTNRDRLNQIAHRLGSGVRVALELMTPEQAQHQDIAGPSHAHVHATHIPDDPHSSISVIRQMIKDTGLSHRSNLFDNVIKDRLENANLSPATLVEAMQMIQSPNHPTLSAMGVTDVERTIILNHLVDLMAYRHGFDPTINEAAQNADNTASNFIGNIIRGMRNTHF